MTRLPPASPPLENGSSTTNSSNSQNPSSSAALARRTAVYKRAEILLNGMNETIIDGAAAMRILCELGNDDALALAMRAGMLDRGFGPVGYPTDQTASDRLWKRAVQCGLLRGENCSSSSSSSSSNNNKSSSSRDDDNSEDHILPCARPYIAHVHTQGGYYDNDDENEQDDSENIFRKNTKIDLAEAARHLQIAVQQGDAVAMNDLGFAYENGEGVEQSDVLAFRYLKMAADRGVAISQTGVARMYMDGQGTERNVPQALKYFAKAVKQGETGALFQQGVMHYCGDHNIANNSNNSNNDDSESGDSKRERDYDRAHELFQQACDQGCRSAANWLGHMYESGMCGYSIRRNYETAISYYQLATDRDDSSGPYNLGRLYDVGSPYRHEPELALKYYRIASERNDARADESLGLLYYYGRGLDADFQRAAHHFRRAAQQNHGFAQACLGVMYFNGDGVEQSFERAVHYFQLAAEQKTVSAMLDLAKMYDDGIGVEKSFQRAVHYFEHAVREDTTSESRDRFVEYLHEQAGNGANALASFQLSVMYRDGRFVDSSEDVALCFLQRAAKQGHPTARNCLWLTDAFSYVMENMAP